MTIDIKALRTRRGMTQAELAKHLGVERATVTNYENGQRRIPVSLLPQLREALGCTWEELFGEEEDNEKAGL